MILTVAVRDVSVSLAVALWVMLVVASVLVQLVVSRRRSQSLQQEAQGMGLSFAPESSPFLNSNTSGLELLGHGEATVVRNLVRGTMDGNVLYLFDLPICASTESMPSCTTVAAFRSLPPQYAQNGQNADSILDRGYQIDRNSDWLLIYRPGTRVAPKDLQAFIRR